VGEVAHRQPGIRSKERTVFVPMRAWKLKATSHLWSATRGKGKGDAPGYGQQREEKKVGNPISQTEGGKIRWGGTSR